MLAMIWITIYSWNHHRHVWAIGKSSEDECVFPAERTWGLTHTRTKTGWWFYGGDTLGSVRKWSAARLHSRSRKASKSPEEWSHYMFRQRKAWACCVSWKEACAMWLAQRTLGRAVTEVSGRRWGQTGEQRWEPGMSCRVPPRERFTSALVRR